MVVDVALAISGLLTLASVTDNARRVGGFHDLVLAHIGRLRDLAVLHRVTVPVSICLDHLFCIALTMARIPPSPHR